MELKKSAILFLSLFSLTLTMPVAAGVLPNKNGCAYVDQSCYHHGGKYGHCQKIQVAELGSYLACRS
jgi:hypothetical protein